MFRASRCSSMLAVTDISEIWELAQSRDQIYSKTPFSDILLEFGKTLTRHDHFQMMLRRRDVCAGLVAKDSSTPHSLQSIAKSLNDDVLSRMQAADKLQTQRDEIKLRLADVDRLLADAMSDKAELEKQLAAVDKELGPLNGIIFDAKDVGQLEGLASSLECCGAVRWADTVVSSLAHPSTPLPNPHHPSLQRSCGALSVALGLSDFSLGTSSRIPAGLLGLSGFHQGENPLWSPGIGSICRTPLDNAIVVGAALSAKFQVVKRSGYTPQAIIEKFDGPLSPSVVCVMSEFDNEGSKNLLAFPAFGQSPPQMLIDRHVERAFWESVDVITKSAPAELTVKNVNGQLCELSHPFFARWMQQAVHLKPTVLSETNAFSLSIDDCKELISAATAWEGHLYGTDFLKSHSNVPQLGGCCLLTPLLRLPYWKACTGKDIACHRGYLPCAAGVDRNNNPISVLDPTFNPYCILADVWRVSSVTIPICITAPHPEDPTRIENVPFALLLTSLRPRRTPIDTQQELDDTLNFLHVAHKLSCLLRRHAPPPVYIPQLWSDAVDKNRPVVWPQDFTYF